MNAGGFSTDRAQWPSPTYRCPGLLGTFREQSGLTYAQLPRRWPWLEVLVGLSVAVAVWIVARRMSFPYALACSLAGGVLVSYHAYLPDYALLLPACLTIFVTTEMLLLRVLALFLLSPPAHFLVGAGLPTSLPVVAATLLLVYLMAYEAWRKGRELKSPRPIQQPPFPR